MAPSVLVAVCGLGVALWHLFEPSQIPTPTHNSLSTFIAYYHTPLPAPETILRPQLIYLLARGPRLAFFLYYRVLSPFVALFHAPFVFVPGRGVAVLGGASSVRHLYWACAEGDRFGCLVF